QFPEVDQLAPEVVWVKVSVTFAACAEWPSSNTAVTVNSGGTFGGTGTVKSVAVTAGGTYSAGNSPGLQSMNTLSVTGVGAKVRVVWERSPVAARSMWSATPATTRVARMQPRAATT